MRALLRLVRRSIALKLTLTLVGFVAVSILAAGLYLNRALEAFAVESLDTRLAALAAVLDGDARAALVAGGPAAQDFANRVARPTGSRSPPCGAKATARKTASPSCRRWCIRWARQRPTSKSSCKPTTSETSPSMRAAWKSTKRFSRT